MTWGVQINGHSEAGPDEQQQYDYLVEKLFDPIQALLVQIEKDGVTKATSAVLNTNAGSYDLMAGKALNRS